MTALTILITVSFLLINTYLVRTLIPEERDQIPMMDLRLYTRRENARVSYA